MEFIPAIDIIDGSCVRLHQGSYAEKTVYDADPLAVASSFFQQGAQRLHIVDLDGAKKGEPVNHPLIETIAAKFADKIIEVGGGIREKEHVDSYLSHGIRKIILGSRAVQDVKFLTEMYLMYGSAIVLGLDVKGGRVATQGWQEKSNMTIFSYLEMLRDKKIFPEVIFTQVESDGTLQGPPMDFNREVVSSFPEFEFITSGGISSIGDVRAILDLNQSINSANIIGMISGKAIYENKISVGDAVKLCASR